MGKIKVGLLIKDELEYELNIRGLLKEGETDTVEAMRPKLRNALKAELGTDSSYVCTAYPYTHAEDIEALKRKLEEVNMLVKEYKSEGKESVYLRCKEKAEFALRRANYMPAVKVEEKKEVLALRSQFILMLGSLFSEGDEGDTDSEEEGSGMLKPNATSTPNLGMNSIKKEIITPVDVSKWNLKFCGDHMGSVNAFLERVEELRIAKGLSKVQLFKAAVELFDEKALIWFRANKEKIRSWDKLVEELRAEFLPADYDDRLWEEIRRRTQGSNETMGVYVAVLERMFSRLNVPCDEAAKLRLLRRNIAPFYQQQLGLTSVETTDELVRLGRVIEATRASVEAFVPPTRARRSLEPDLAYVDAPMTDTNMEVQIAALRCWRCQQEGHMARDCEGPIGCYGCGNPGVRWRDCQQCKRRLRENRENGEWRRESRVRGGIGVGSWRNAPREAVGNGGNTRSEEGRSVPCESSLENTSGNRQTNEREYEYLPQRSSNNSGNEVGAR